VPTRPLTIVGLGDSTTAGTPFFRSPVEAPPDGAGNPEGQYSHWMAKLHPEWRVLNRGVNGERSDQILRRVERDALTAQPEYVIVLAGVNDIYQGRGVQAVQAILRTTYDRIAAAGILVVAATVLPFDTASRRQSEAIRALNLWIAQQCEMERWSFCDTNSLVSDPESSGRLAGSPDGLHPDVPRYRRMGEGLARVIEAAEHSTTSR
jgi:lysophospholipase L1-like esterase